MSEKTDEEIAVWLTARANQGNFTVGDVRRFSAIGRATVCAWMSDDATRRRLVHVGIDAAWVRAWIFEEKAIVGSTDPGQP